MQIEIIFMIMALSLKTLAYDTFDPARYVASDYSANNNCDMDLMLPFFVNQSVTLNQVS